MPKALFIGRFQPFHLGHMDAIQHISENEIIIGIGSSQYSDTDENPWTFEERKKMIEEALHDENIHYKIIAIPDIHDEKNWVDHVKTIVGSFDVVYTGNDWVGNLFEEKNYLVKKIKIKIEISGTKLRKKIKTNNENWEKFISPNITKLIKSSPF